MGKLLLAESKQRCAVNERHNGGPSVQQYAGLLAASASAVQWRDPKLVPLADISGPSPKSFLEESKERVNPLVPRPKKIKMRQFNFEVNFNNN